MSRGADNMAQPAQQNGTVQHQQQSPAKQGIPQGAAPARPTVEAALEHCEICKVRRVQDAFEEIRKKAVLQNSTVEEELQIRGYRRFEDFILSCKQFPLLCNIMDFAELGSYEVFRRIIAHSNHAITAYPNTSLQHHIPTGPINTHV